MSDLDLSEWDDVDEAEEESTINSNETTNDSEEDWNDAVEIEVLENYCSTMMGQMETFRKHKIMCDAVIVVNDQELPCHRNVLSAVSPFFKNIFSQITNPEENVITLRNLSGEVMDNILHYMYTGEAYIHDGNVRQLVATANFLQIFSLKDLTVNFLENKLSPASAAEILILSSKHNCETLSNLSEKMVTDNFVIVSRTDGFKKLPFEILHQFVQSEDIRVVKEEEVLEAVILWVSSQNDSVDVQNNCVELMHNIRFPLITPSYLSELLENNEFVKRNKQCYNVIQDAKNYHVSNNKSNIYEAKLFSPRMFMGVINAILCIGGLSDEKVSSDVYSYIPTTFKWYPLSPLSKGRYLHAVCQSDGYVYCLGGRDESTKLTSSVERFNPTYNKWEDVCPLPFQASLMGVCQFEGQIYCIGGLCASGSIDTTFRYSSRYNSWQRVANLKCPRGALAVVCNKRFMFAIGGIRKSGSGIESQWEYLDTMEIYQHEYNTWTYSTDLLTKRAHASAVCLRENIYLFGGKNELSGGNYLGLDVYDIELRVWSTIPYPYMPRSMCGLTAVDDKIFVVGGIAKDGVSVNTVETYDTVYKRWSKVSVLPVSTSSLQCCTQQLRLAVLHKIV